MKCLIVILLFFVADSARVDTIQEDTIYIKHIQQMAIVNSDMDSLKIDLAKILEHIKIDTIK